jgi:hypothetical protein
VHDTSSDVAAACALIGSIVIRTDAEAVLNPTPIFPPLPDPAETAGLATTTTRSTTTTTTTVPPPLSALSGAMPVSGGAGGMAAIASMISGMEGAAPGGGSKMGGPLDMDKVEALIGDTGALSERPRALFEAMKARQQHAPNSHGGGGAAAIANIASLLSSTLGPAQHPRPSIPPPASASISQPSTHLQTLPAPQQTGGAAHSTGVEADEGSTHGVDGNASGVTRLTSQSGAIAEHILQAMEAMEERLRQQLAMVDHKLSKRLDRIESQIGAIAHKD